MPRPPIPGRLRAAALVLLLAAAGGLASGGARATDIKLATWNLNWFTARPAGDPALPDDVKPRAPADFGLLAAYAGRLRGDIVAVEEVDGPQMAARLFPPDRYRIEMTGDHVIQRVGLAIRRDLAVERHQDVTGLDTSGPAAAHHLRSGLDVTVTIPAQGDAPPVALRILAVHLKTGCWDHPLHGRLSPACTVLRRQVAVLRDWVAARQAEGVPFIVMGDFNRDLLAGDEFMTALRGAAPLTQADSGYASPCWGGESFIDHILAGGAARDWIRPDTLRVMVYREHDPEMKDHLSDHCPVSVHFAVGPATRAAD